MSQRLVVVSNRLPFVVSRDAEGNTHVRPGSGGLITALAPVLRHRGGSWIGWPGIEEVPDNLGELFAQKRGQTGYEVHPVRLTTQEVNDFYHGCSNEEIWPLFHDLQSMCDFEPQRLRAYADVNRKYAQVIAAHAAPGDFIWVHDYQLMLTGEALHELGFVGELSFFLHIPFPSLDIFLKFPGRHRLLRGLLHYDLIGFQTERDRRNFIHCVRTLLGDVHVGPRDRLQLLATPEREVSVGVFPISIPYREFRQAARSGEVRQRTRVIEESLPGRRIILGIDRLDYTKGLIHRLRAYDLFLKSYPEYHRQVTLMQVVVPSRVEIAKYAHLKREIERMVGEINGRYTETGWVPIHYQFQSLPYDLLLAHYQTAEIALVTPLKDGMNLVCKEFCACCHEGRGVLILSEFAGAAAQLQRGALLVNPYDIEQVAQAIRQALEMPTQDRRIRMRRMRRQLQQQDLSDWVDSFMRAAIDRDLSAFPLVSDYIPPDPDEVAAPVRSWVSGY